MENFSLESDLQELVKTSRFLQAIIDKTTQNRLTNFPHLDRKKLKWNRLEWAARWFFVNLARGNIINFHINKFDNNEINKEDIVIILENIEKGSSRRNSNERNSDSDPDSSGSKCDSEKLGIEGEAGFQIVRKDSESPRTLEEKSKILTLLGIESGNNKVKIIDVHYGKIIEFLGYKVKMDFRKLQLLIDKYIGPMDKMMEYIFCLGFRYNLISESGFQLAIPREVTSLVQFECFGSAYNTVKPYFSAFPEVEKYFGSRGGFFTHNIPKEFDLISFNPPFDEIVFEMASKRLLEQMKNRNLTVVCTLPVWDPETQSKHGFYQSNRKFEAFDILIASAYLKEKRVLTREQAPFYDYINKKLIAAVNIHLIILSSGSPKITINTIMENWPKC